MTIDVRLAAFKHRLTDPRARQSVWSMMEYLAYPLMMFLATPVFLSTLGAQQYGQWMLLLTFNGFGGAAGLGMGAAAIKEVSELRGKSDMPAAANAVRNCLAVTLASSLILATAMIGLGLTVAPGWLAKIGPFAIVSTIIVAASILITLEQVDVVFAGAIKGCERFELSALSEVISKFVAVLTSIIIAYITRNLLWIIATTIFIAVMRTTIKSHIAAMLLQNGLLYPIWNHSTINRVFAFGKWTWTQGIASTLFATADRLIVGGVLGAESLARYGICLQLAQQVQAIPAAAAQVIFPLVSRMRAEGKDIRITVSKAMTALCILSAIIVCPMIFLRNEILELWVGSNLSHGIGPILLVLSISFAILSVNNVPHYVLLGLGRSKVIAIINLAAGIASICCCYAGIHYFGLLGATLGRLAYGVIVCAVSIEMFRQFSSKSGKISIKI